MTPQDAPGDALVERLRALASPVRLQILRALVSPTRPADVRVRAGGERAGLGAERMLGRSTVIEHLDVLEQARLVRRIGDAYAVDQQAMVALLQDLGDLARLRALVEVDVEVTLSSPPPAIQPLPRLPRFLVGNGPEAGRAFPLDGAGPWRVGRGLECEVPLRHDPHASRVHVVIEKDAEGFAVRASPTAKNPALLDFQPLEPGARRTIRAGAVVLVGASLLVLQA